ncbi:protein AGENET DOMAIN (AGD)-CONTAINING P1 isoform X1 [Aegilops tauschii subsp. strangulata]|nr:protein AGENET DOMAIN (AGD)-CONTAINING P1 isoform X1 [Aegilops tauschii subsp. strangulata]
MRSPRLRRQPAPAPSRASDPAEPTEVFPVGKAVEVLPDEGAYRGAHLPAVVARFDPGLRSYAVEYDALAVSGASGRALPETVPASQVRPRPPPPSPAPHAEHAAVDALRDGAWWLGVALVGGGRADGKVAVRFPATREEAEFDLADVRPHLEWVAGEWRSPEDMETSKRTLYAKGTQIEVARLEADSVVAWFPAIVAKTIWKNNLLVEYPFWKGSELCNEIIDIKHIRPCPPRASVISFCVNDDVEGFQDDGWWPGKITEIHPKLTYTFKSATSGKKVQLHQNTLRLRYDWTDNQWKQVAQNLSGTKFTGGDRVEVSSDEEGFHGAWFQGTVVKSVGHKFLVEYDALKDDDETTPLKETIGEEHIRPSPPAIPVTNGFKVLDEIDAYTNDGWWVGVISEVLSNQKYKVYFKAYKEQDEFELEQLRRHCDWVGGRWIQASLVTSTAYPLPRI